MSIESSSIILIPLTKLVPSVQNVRKTTRQEGVPELAASILAHSLRQNLSVVERGDGKCRPYHLQDHAAYIGSWMKHLKNDKRAFFRAAGNAQTAVDWLLAKSPAALVNLTATMEAPNATA